MLVYTLSILLSERKRKNVELSGSFLLCLTTDLTTGVKAWQLIDLVFLRVHGRVDIALHRDFYIRVAHDFTERFDVYAVFHAPCSEGVAKGVEGVVRNARPAQPPVDLFSPRNEVNRSVVISPAGSSPNAGRRCFSTIML